MRCCSLPGTETGIYDIHGDDRLICRAHRFAFSVNGIKKNLMFQPQYLITINKVIRRFNAMYSEPAVESKPCRRLQRAPAWLPRYPVLGRRHHRVDRASADDQVSQIDVRRRRDRNDLRKPVP